MLKQGFCKTSEDLLKNIMMPFKGQVHQKMKIQIQTETELTISNVYFIIQYMCNACQNCIQDILNKLQVTFYWLCNNLNLILIPLNDLHEEMRPSARLAISV